VEHELERVVVIGRANVVVEAALARNRRRCRVGMTLCSIAAVWSFAGIVVEEIGILTPLGGGVWLALMVPGLLLPVWALRTTYAVEHVLDLWRSTHDRGDREHLDRLRLQLDDPRLH
jgi:hypothetical protein